MGIVAAVQIAPVFGDSMAGGEQIHVAPTLAQGSPIWVTAMRHIANEGRMWVVSPGSFLAAQHLPDDLRAIGEYDDDQILNPGGSLIVDPEGSVIAGPLLGEEGILYADCDPSVALDDHVWTVT